VLGYVIVHPVNIKYLILKYFLSVLHEMDIGSKASGVWSWSRAI